MIEHLEPVSFSAGEVIFAEGDTGTCLYLIVCGKVKVAYRHAEGRHVVLNIVGATDLFGETTPFDDGVRAFTATAVTDVAAMPIERDQLVAWMARCPEISLQIMRLLVRRAEAMTGNLLDFAFTDARYRIARRLLVLGQRFGRQEGDVVQIKHDLTLDEFALYAGTDPETVREVMGDFRDRGWIRFEGNHTEIVDGHSLTEVPATDA